MPRGRVRAREGCGFSGRAHCFVAIPVRFTAPNNSTPQTLPPQRARSPLGLAKVIAVMATNVGLMRLKKELKMLYEDPPPGISAWAQEENFHEIEAGAAHIGISVRSLVADQHADC